MRKKLDWTEGVSLRMRLLVLLAVAGLAKVSTFLDKQRLIPKLLGSKSTAH